jgi:hypothetical protein
MTMTEIFAFVIRFVAGGVIGALAAYAIGGPDWRHIAGGFATGAAFAGYILGSE